MKTQRRSGSNLLAICVLTALTACGGGGDSAGVSPFPQQTTTSPSGSVSGSSSSDVAGNSAAGGLSTEISSTPTIGRLEGFFIGTASSGYDFGVVALENGVVWGIYLRGSVIYGAVRGLVLANATTFSGSGYDFDLRTGTRTPATINGTFVAKQSIAGTAGSANFSGTYDDSYDRPASLADIAGTWTGDVASPAGLQRSTVVIDASGNFAGSVTTCAYAGTARPRPSGKAVFDTVVRFAASGCVFNGQTLQGIAVVQNGQLLSLALTADGTAGFLAAAHR